MPLFSCLFTYRIFSYLLFMLYIIVLCSYSIYYSLLLVSDIIVVSRIFCSNLAYNGFLSARILSYPLVSYCIVPILSCVCVALLVVLVFVFVSSCVRESFLFILSCLCVSVSSLIVSYIILVCSYLSFVFCY